MDKRSEREAIAWHDRLERDRSRKTIAAFEAWRRADPRHARAFEQQVRLAERLPQSAFKAERPRRVARAIAWPRLATAGVVAVALVALWPRVDPIGPGSIASPSATLYLLTRPVRLADGSLVVLGTDARVALEPEGGLRRVRLTGGPARFIVALDPTQPFVALAGSVSVAANEAVFDIEPTAEGPRVTLVEGTAEVSREAADDTGAVRLAPGQALDPAAPTPRPVTPEPQARLGPLEVDDMAVADVLAIAERAAGTRVAVADRAVGQRRITGRFDVRDAPALARKLAAALDLAVDTTGPIPTLRAR